jgi:hypothetical protein
VRASRAGRGLGTSSPLADMRNAGQAQHSRIEESRPMNDHHKENHNDNAGDYIMLPVGTRDFILQALRDTNMHLFETHRVRATSAILVAEGVKLTKANSFMIDHRDHLLLTSLAEKLLTRKD